MIMQTRSWIALSAALAAGCVVPATGCSQQLGLDDAEPIGSTASAVTTTTLVSSTTLQSRRSKSGYFVAPTTGDLVFNTTGSGDVDLYVRVGSAASRWSYDCRSTGADSTETCRVHAVDGQRVYYYLYAWTGSEVSLSVDVPDVTPPAPVTTIELVPRAYLTEGSANTGLYRATADGQITFRSSGIGDVDLYIKNGSPASASSYDCKGEGPTADETCTVTVAAGNDVYYRLYAYATSTASLVVDVPEETEPPTTVTTELFASTPLAEGSYRSGSYAVEAAGQVVFATAGTGDVDLYIKSGPGASRSNYDCKSEGYTSVESCALNAATGDQISYYVYAYDTSTANLSVTAPSSSTPPLPDTLLPPWYSYCAPGSACAGAVLDMRVCAEGTSDCTPSRSSTVRWTVNGYPVGSIALNMRGETSGISTTLQSGPGSWDGYFLRTTAASTMVIHSDLDILLSYYDIVPTWGGTTSVNFDAATIQASGGSTTFFQSTGYAAGVTGQQLSTRTTGIAADVLDATQATGVPAYKAFFLPTEMAAATGGEGNYAYSDGTVTVNYGNPAWIDYKGGIEGIVAHEFSHEFTHVVFANSIQSNFQGNSACLNEGLADAVGNVLGYVPDSDFGTGQDGSTFEQGCESSTEIHAKGNCVFWNMKHDGALDHAAIARLFAPQHTLSFDSCDLTNSTTGNAYVVYLTEAAGGVDMSAMVTRIGIPNAGSYAAAKAALGL